jgi:hypothetical protein
MQKFEDFLATTYFPPNPYRNFDNSLPTAVELKGQEAFGEFLNAGGLPPGVPLLVGNAVRGLDLYRFRPAHTAGPGGSNTAKGGNPCVMCHTLPTGMGADVSFVGDLDLFPVVGSGGYVDNAVGSKGERNLMLTGFRLGDGIKQIYTIKVPQLRNMHDKRGFNLVKSPSLSGFGFFHDGSPTLDRFIVNFDGVENDQEAADINAFLLSYSGSDLPMGSLDNLEEPPGPLGQDSHAAVGKQVTFNGANNSDAALVARLGEMQTQADAGKVGLVAHGIVRGTKRGYAYSGAGAMKADSRTQTATVESLRLGAADGAEITFTVVPKGSETRLGIDRDLDGVLDLNDPHIQ